ncbi:MAG: carbamoyl-phosphate synthase (glutamine-hydrolyzing) large subunit [Clostridiales bacterium]|jgi:carbamoyl-phosphate synthase large subunit|nr:carbamoyl-phosphate synthase (glutamine-hydrolyzing) large subunit [Clostridiales bacterium]
MPFNHKIKKILVIGSGATVIGQGAEFDYSGAQACAILKQENIETVIINDNLASIMTEKGVANTIYIEPLNIEIVEKIIIKEKPSHIIGSMGGQTALNLLLELQNEGILGKNKVRVAGTSFESIENGEDRKKFKKLMQKIKQPVIKGDIANDVISGVKIAEEIDYPVVVRPAYTLAGTGGGYAKNEKELREILICAINISAIGQVMIEKSIKGWKEIEFEVIRDNIGNCVVVCSMENIDPVGIHTGDSIVIAPTQTLNNVEYQILRSAAIEIVNAAKINGGCNVQFAVNPKKFEYYVIEINPRISRSSALASKATGYPIAKISTKIALGYNLDEIINEVTGKTYACFEPALDYCVIKIPKWPFDKFLTAKKQLGTKMMATGEVMALSNNIESALMKAIRSLDINQHSLENDDSKTYRTQELKRKIETPDDERIFYIAELIRREYNLEKISEITGINLFFLNKIKNIVVMEEELKNYSIDNITSNLIKKYKQKGFSDKGIAEIIKCKESQISNLRIEYGIFPTYKMVDTCAGEFEAVSPYYYSTYENHNEVIITEGKRILVVGSGPTKIGQGIEFDYCSVNCVLALKKAGVQTIIINNNPATVSTDFNISDKLYFEPLTLEDVMNVVSLEKVFGVILQFGGQTSIKLATTLKKMGVNVLGTSPESIDKTENREKFDVLLENLKIKRPKGKAINTVQEGLDAAKEIIYPMLVRPSYVLGGQGMEIVYNDDELTNYLNNIFKKNNKNSVLIDKYLEGIEIEVDAVCDGDNIFVPGIMKHLNRAGVHSGDSISIYPANDISNNTKKKIIEITEKISLALNVIGMINIQFIEFENEIYVIEVNLRSSRTISYISKVTDLNVVEIATRIILGEKLKDIGFTGLFKEIELFAVKVPVFSTEKLPMVEISLGPEMRSTGETLGVGKTILEALYKGFLGAKINIPPHESIILATICDNKKEEFLDYAKRLFMLGVRFIGTIGTTTYLRNYGIEIQSVRKISEPNSNILEVIQSGVIDLIIDIPKRNNNYESDGFKIRRISAENNITILTSMDAVNYMTQVMEKNFDESDLNIFSLDEIF